MRSPIYLDYMATTPVDPRVIAKMQHCLSKEGYFGNAASVTHQFGWWAKELIEQARCDIAEVLNADAQEIIWTSGATESNNLALKGAVQFYQRKGKHIITSSIEHKSVLDVCQFLESHGFEITYLNPQANGLIDPQEVRKNIRSDTLLVSIMHVNNEIGVIQDIQAIAEIVKQQGVLFHVDAAQSLGKLAIDLQKLPVDLMSFSAHKIYGPKGIGALYVRRRPRVRLQPLFHGGGQEFGLRSGTLPTHQIIGFATACEIAIEEMAQENLRLRKLRDKLWEEISQLDEVYLNGDDEQRVVNNLNVSFNYVEGESLLLMLRDIAVSSGSACTSATIEPSHVLRAIGRKDELAHSTIRFSLGRFTTEQEIAYTTQHIKEAVTKLRAMSPLWAKKQGASEASAI